jgi:hypothetical protein
MGSYLSNLEEDLSGVEAALAKEELSSSEWEELDAKKTELEEKIRAAD